MKVLQTKMKVLQTGSKICSRLVMALAVSAMVLLGFGTVTAQAAETLSLTGDATYTSEVLSMYGTINLNGHTLTVPGDFTTSATIDMGQYGTLVVNGNMTTGGTVSVSKSGTLTVNGNYIQRDNALAINENATVTITGNAEFKDTGCFVQYDITGKVILGGDFIYSSTQGSSSTSYWKGTNPVWKIAGNITQTSEAGAVYFYKLILTGNDEQKVTLQSNTSVYYISSDNGKVALTGYLQYIRGFADTTLDSDLVITPIGKVYYSNLVLNGYNLTINGDMVAIGSVSVSKNSTLAVNGNYTQVDSALIINENATATITGNAEFKDTGRYWQNGKTGKVILGGDFLYSSTSTSSDAGSSSTTYPIWKIAGNITQEDEAGAVFFYKLTLTGSDEQKLALQSNSSVYYISSDNGKVALTGYLQYIIGLAYTTLDSDLVITPIGKVYYSDIVLNGYNLTTNGDMVAIGSVFVSDNSTLTVNGNYTQQDKRIWLGESSKVLVSGDMTFQNAGYYSGDSGGKVEVGSNLEYNSVTDVSYNKIEWTVSGNVTQGEETGKVTFQKLTMPTAGTALTLTNGSVTTLTLGNGKSKYTITPDNCYTNLIATSKLTFDPNGGKTDTTDKTVTTNEVYGELPTALNADFAFDGWYTEAEGGTQIKKEDKVTAVDDFTVYAHWVQKSFDDVKKTDWYYNAVTYAYNNNIMAGTGAEFRPNDSLTREQFTQVLYNHKGKPEVAVENPYTDVKNEWYKNSVLWAKENNIANGKGAGVFGVGANITREELALMLYKYAKLCGFDTTATETAIEPYGDTEMVSSWAKNAMNWAVTKGIMSGKGQGTDLSAYKLDPQGNATRAECASMMKKLLTMNESE